MDRYDIINSSYDTLVGMNSGKICFTDTSWRCGLKTSIEYRREINNNDRIQSYSSPS